MEKFDTRDVFTPTKPAILTFVDREYINNKLVDALKTPGKQLVVYGHSGSGKTTLLVNKLRQLYENHITTRCMGSLTFEHLLLDAFDQLNPFYISEEGTYKKSTISSSIQADYLLIKSKIDLKASEGKHIKEQRMLPPQLTPQRLASFIGEANCCWVIEDFHKMPEEEKKKLAQVMKIFMDMAVDYNELKIIAIGAVGTAREVVAYDSEMRNRVAEIHVPLMENDEILKILEKGEGLLNISILNKIKADIVNYSNGLASVCHQMGLNLCFASEIVETVEATQLIESSHFKNALERYIENESDTIKSSFDKALKQKRKQKFNNCKLILETLSQQEGDDGITRADILSSIKEKEPLYPPGNLSIYLKELQQDLRGGIVRYDEKSGKYLFMNPFHKVFARVLFSKDKRIGISSIIRFESLDDFVISNYTIEYFDKAIKTMAAATLHEVGHTRIILDSDRIIKKKKNKRN
jgi:hypothetical protein